MAELAGTSSEKLIAHLPATNVVSLHVINEVKAFLPNLSALELAPAGTGMVGPPALWFITNPAATDDGMLFLRFSQRAYCNAFFVKNKVYSNTRALQKIAQLLTPIDSKYQTASNVTDVERLNSHNLFPSEGSIATVVLDGSGHATHVLPNTADARAFVIDGAWHALFSDRECCKRGSPERLSIQQIGRINERRARRRNAINGGKATQPNYPRVLLQLKGGGDIEKNWVRADVWCMGPRLLHQTKCFTHQAPLTTHQSRENHTVDTGQVKIRYGEASVNRLSTESEREREGGGEKERERETHVHAQGHRHTGTRTHTEIYTYRDLENTCTRTNIFPACLCGKSRL